MEEKSQIDPNNPVVKLCAEGMQAEAEGRPDDARDLFWQAWENAQDDYEACMAAHFLARHQENLQDMLYWNQESLRRAEAVGDGRVSSFYPSLYLNLGRCHEFLGDQAEADKYYRLAAERVDDLPAGPYSDMIRNGAAEGRKRTGSVEE